MQDSGWLYSKCYQSLMLIFNMEKTVVKAISELDLVSELNEKSEIQQNYFSCVIGASRPDGIPYGFADFFFFFSSAVSSDAMFCAHLL